MYIGISGASKLPIRSVSQKGCGVHALRSPFASSARCPRRGLRHLIAPSAIGWLKITAHGGAPVTPSATQLTVLRPHDVNPALEMGNELVVRHERIGFLDNTVL